MIIILIHSNYSRVLDIKHTHFLLHVEHW